MGEEMYEEYKKMIKGVMGDDIYERKY